MRNLVAWAWDNLFTLRAQNAVWEMSPRLGEWLDANAFRRDRQGRHRAR